uniref:TEP1-F n=1 Tax=Musca domestica TaxID=7370 RepID=A0A1I8M759_MUSDO
MQLQSGLYNVLLLTLAFISASTSESYYSAVAPGTIKSNRNYSVCLSLHNAPKPAVIRVSLIGEPLFNYVQNVDLKPFETKTISFLPPKLDSSLNYSLQVEGVQGFVFYNSTKLQADPIDSLKIYIQTDKGTYKPGDVVQFRIVVLDEHLKPFKSIEPIQVEIVDPNGNRIKQFKDIKLNTGVYTNKFNLSEQTVLGQWLILASVLGKYEKSSGRNFKVEKYILPKFGVYIDADSDFILDDNEFSLTVYGKYTFGKYVEGTATVAILNPATNMTMSKQEATLDTYRASFTFQYYDIPLAQMFSWIIISATIKERHTGITQSTLQELSVRKQKYNILVPENEIEFHNGKPYKIKAMAQHWNGSCVLDTITPMTMIHANRTYETHLDANGVGTFPFDYVDKEVNVFNYAGSSTHLQNIVIGQNYRFDQSSEAACTLKWKEGRLKFGTTIDL